MEMTIPKTMTAVRYHERGGAEVLRIEEIPVPEPGEGEVLVEVRAIGVNPGDWQIRRGLAGDKFPLPYTPGWDLSGMAVRKGPNVERVNIGDAVFGLTANSGACATYAVVPAAQLAPKPDALSFEAAAALPMSAFTAFRALFGQGGLQAGQTVVVRGAAGGVGHFAVQLAKALGAEVVGIASARSGPFVRGLGANRVHAYDQAPIAALGRIADLAIDTVGGDEASQLLDVVKPGGAIVPVTGGRYDLRLAEREAITVHKVLMPPMDARELERLGRQAAEGRLRVHLERVYPFRETALAHARLEAGGGRGKLVIRAGEA